MEADADRRFQKQLNGGATSLALLGLLSQAQRAMYGYEIAKALQEICGKPLPMNQGALYPVLRSLEEQGLLSAYVEPSISGPARKYYQITAEGRQTLRRWLLSWQSIKEFVDSVLENDHDIQRKRSDSPVSRRAAQGTKPSRDRVP